jgi:glycosyltransferase involved in cell wall biosynthesis
MTQLVVVIPALNEEATIGELVTTLRVQSMTTVCVVDDASGDETAAEALRAGAEVLQLATQLGPWGATQAGIRRACELGFENVLTMDADGQHFPDAISTLTSAMRSSDADMVIGSAPARGSRLRNIAWKMIRLVSGLRITDLTSGFRLYNSEAMALIANERASYLQYQDIGILALALENKLRIVEVPVEMAQRQQGVSRIFNSWLSVGVYMLNTLLLGFSKRSRYKKAKQFAQ